MTVLSSNQPARSSSAAVTSLRTFDTLATLLIVCLAVTILYVGREILVPIAVAVLLSFVLSPPIKLLRNIGLPKSLAVGIIVFLSFSTAVGLGFVLAKQITDLAEQAPRYQATVQRKIEFAQNFLAHNPFLAKINGLVSDFKEQTAPGRKPASGTGDSATHTTHGGEPRKPMPVEIVSAPPDALSLLQTLGGAAASPVATAAFVTLFVIFMLMQREDLRNRFIRLVGSGDLNLTTLAMNEAAARLSRYFLAQVLLNTAFGLVVAGGLTLIGVPSPILWGIVATCMRFVPYLGTVGAAFFPVLMATAVGEGWSMTIETAVFFALIELVTGQVIEPLLYGHHTGVSPLAVVISATFWTWLWGPIGLLLSTPLTVCIAVMGRHVERLSFLYVLLGDAPALSPAETFYQRMLVGDSSEVAEHAETFLEDHSLLAYCDQVAMKALLMAQLDVRRGTLEPERQAVICGAMRDLVDDLVDMETSAPKAKVAEEPVASPIPGAASPPPEEPVHPADLVINPQWKRERAVVCVAGRTALDEAAANILADLIAQHGIGAYVEPAGSLLTNKLAHLRSPPPELVFLSFLDADLSIAQARFAVRRLRRNIPNVPIVAAFWMPEADENRASGLCADVRCDVCVSSLPEALHFCLDKAALPPAAAAA